MPNSYWDRVLTGRMTRRRALAATGASAAAAAFLAACGGGDDDSGGGGGGSGSTGSANSIITKTTDSKRRPSAAASSRTAPTPTLQLGRPAPIAPLNNPAKHVYSTLVRSRRHIWTKKTSWNSAPDFAESWEVSPDGMTITFKTRATPSGTTRRPSTAASPTPRTSSTAGTATPPPHLCAVSPPTRPTPARPSSAVTATDARTVSVKLKEPLVYALNLFASYGSFTGNIVIMPKEAEETASRSRREMIGTGPYFLDKYEPSQGFTLKRNPDYWDQNANLVEQIDIPDHHRERAGRGPAQGWQHPLLRRQVCSPRDVFTLKRDEPRLQIYALDLQTANRS